MSKNEVAILGAGMHPWGKWGRNFVEYGVVALKEAIKDAGIEWKDVDFVVGGDTMRNGYPGYVAGATFAKAMGWTGIPIASCYAACATGAQAIEIARTRILAGMAQVAAVGADTTPKGFLAPNKGERTLDPDWLRFRLLGDEPDLFRSLRPAPHGPHGATEQDFARIKVKNSKHGFTNPNARYRQIYTEAEVLASPLVAAPLRLFEICATSDGAAALVLCSMEYAKKKGIAKPVRISAVSTVSPTFPNTIIDMPDFSTDSAAGIPAPDRSFKDSISYAAYQEAGVDPSDVNLAEVYDLSSALELDWYENIGLCKPGEAEGMLRSGATELGGRVPVNPSGGLSCFGEAVPAQAIAQVCELTWQLRGTAGERQVEGAKVGITANQGLFGHGSSVLCTR
ncbi:MAG: lipid-transfer protein [Myxococcota bacterium]